MSFHSSCLVKVLFLCVYVLFFFNFPNLKVTACYSASTSLGFLQVFTGGRYKTGGSLLSSNFLQFVRVHVFQAVCLSVCRSVGSCVHFIATP